MGKDEEWTRMRIIRLSIHGNPRSPEDVRQASWQGMRAETPNRCFRAAACCACRCNASAEANPKSAASPATNRGGAAGKRRACTCHCFLRPPPSNLRSGRRPCYQVPGRGHVFPLAGLDGDVRVLELELFESSRFLCSRAANNGPFSILPLLLHFVSMMFAFDRMH